MPHRPFVVSQFGQTRGQMGALGVSIGTCVSSGPVSTCDSCTGLQRREDRDRRRNG